MSNKRDYNYIELWKRKSIIQCALDKSKSIKKRAVELGVKYITAKQIVKLYKQTGRIVTKGCRNQEEHLFDSKKITNASENNETSAQSSNYNNVSKFEIANASQTF